MLLSGYRIFPGWTQLLKMIRYWYVKPLSPLIYVIKVNGCTITVLATIPPKILRILRFVKPYALQKYDKGLDSAGSTVKRWLCPRFCLLDLQLPVRNSGKPDKISGNSSHSTHTPVPLTTRHRRRSSRPASTLADTGAHQALSNVRTSSRRTI